MDGGSFMISRFFYSIGFVALIGASAGLQGYYDEHKNWQSLVFKTAAQKDFEEMNRLAEPMDTHGGYKQKGSKEEQLLSPTAALSLGVFSDDGLYGTLKPYCTTKIGRLLLADILWHQEGVYDTAATGENFKNISDHTIARVAQFSQQHSPLLEKMIETLTAVKTTQTIPSDMGGALFTPGEGSLWRHRYVQNLKWAFAGTSAFYLAALLGQAKVVNGLQDLLRSGDMAGFSTALAAAPLSFAREVITGIFPAYNYLHLFKTIISNGDSRQKGLAAFNLAFGLIGTSTLAYNYVGIRSQYAREHSRVRSQMEAVYALAQLLPKDSFSQMYGERIKKALESPLPGDLQELYAQLMYSNKVRFKMLLIDAYKEFGKLDALCAVKKWANKHKGFVSDIQPSDKMTCSLKNMWALEIGPQKSSRVSIAFDEKTKVLKIEGPNGFGKSTILRMLANNVILANRFGIVAAAPGSTIPDYRKLLYVANVQETRGSASTGQAQGKSFQDTLTSIAEAGENTIVILDEPLSGTRADVAEQPINDLISAVEKNKNAHGVIVTHHAIDLSHHNTVKHVHLGSKQDEPLKPSYTLEKGNHSWWFEAGKKAQELRSQFSAYMFGYKDLVKTS